MAFPLVYRQVGGETAVDIGLMIDSDDSQWTWLHSSASRPARLVPSEWPPSLANSIDNRNQARNGAQKGRTLVVSSGPPGEHRRLLPVAVMAWHVHGGNWPVTVLDMGYRLGLDEGLGRDLVEDVLLGALAEINDAPQLQDRAVKRPTDCFGWAVSHQAGAGSDKDWARTVAERAMSSWGFAVVKPKSARPSWARDGFYGQRPR